MKKASKETYRSHLVFYLNGERVEIDDVDPSLLLVDYLRSAEVGLTGTKKVCAQGGCGACTVMLASWDPAREAVDFRSINSCLHPVAALDGMALTTTEGLGSVNTEVSPVQYRIAKDNGSQCGYCTPGWVMNMTGFLARNQGQRISQEEIENAFDGNLCRCTGYRPILYAMRHFASDWNPERDEEGCMKCLVDPGDRVKVAKEIDTDFPLELRRKVEPVHFAGKGYEWWRPVNLDQLYHLRAKYAAGWHKVKLVAGNTSIGIYDRYEWNPRVLIDISQIPELQEIHLGRKHLVLGAAVTYSQLLEFLDAQVESAPAAARQGLVALRYLAHRTAGTIVRNAASLAGNTMLVVEHMPKGSGAPFPSDLFTALCALGAEVRVGAPAFKKPKRYPILEFAEKFHAKDAEGEALRHGGVLLDYHIPLTREDEVARTFKVAIRHENAHSIVNAGMRIAFAGDKVGEASVVYGGIGAVAFHATAVEKFLVGRVLDGKTLAGALTLLRKDVDKAIKAAKKRLADQPWDGFTDAYRRSMTEAFFYQFFIYALDQRWPGSVRPELRSAGERYLKGLTRGRQTIQTYPEEYPVSLPIIKRSAFMQATGEAKYVHDFAVPVRGLSGALVISDQALARFHYRIPGGEDWLGLDEFTAYLKRRFPGVAGYITYRDVPGQNLHGAGDDPLFCPMAPTLEGLEGQVNWFGQSIGMVLAEDENLAQNVAHFISTEAIVYLKVDRQGRPMVPILTIEEAIAQGSIFVDKPPYPVHIWKVTRPDSVFDWTTQKGRRKIGGIECEILHAEHFSDAQVHFYMEAQSCYVEIDENRQVKVFPSSQSPDSVQTAVMQTLGLPAAKVEVAIRRVGGGYGGKTTRSPFIAAPTAVAAWASGRPVKLALVREVDTATIGKRHPLRTQLALAIGTGKEDPANKGLLVGLDTAYVFDGGATYDCSFVVMDCLQLRSDSAYRVGNYRSSGEVAKTNKASNTAYRAFGLIQSMLAVEDAIERASHQIGMLAEDVRSRNLYELGDLTPYGEKLNYCYLRDVWDYARKVSDFDRRLEEVRAYNRQNRWRKRGICLMPLKYGSGYNLTSLEQTGALIEIFDQDASILVRQGSVEMGQGTLTKIAQIAALELNVPLGLIEMAEMNSSVIPNPTSTGASTGTAYGGGAVKLAAMALRHRLETYVRGLEKLHGEAWCQQNGVDFWNYREGWRAEVEVNGNKTLMWKNLIGMAYNDRINLSAEARFRQKGGRAIDTGLSFHEVDGVSAYEVVQHFVGYTFNAACSEVEIDTLTGETFIRRCDVIYDMGKSLNPAIDVGQVEGAFMQGVGYVLTEKTIFQPDGENRGQLNTLNTWTYKPPATSTLPEQLNVYLYPRELSKNVPEDPFDLLSSKEVGEPPLVLAVSVFCAIKKAVMACREDLGRGEAWVDMVAPATPEAVRMACGIEPGDLRLD